MCLVYKLKTENVDTSEFLKCGGFFQLIKYIFICVKCVFVYMHICTNIHMVTKTYINVYIEIIINVPIKCTVFKWKVVQIALEIVI